ncbi:hypothetical protein [Rhizobium sp. RAF56]|jgi:hypothetical protein|uniref:hypothetical protein n=1 Tax=Rhizobium sp. RAF56 TaxID=3233062 RepID=UPI003F999325
MTETVANLAALAFIAIAAIGTAFAAVAANRMEDERRRVRLPIRSEPNRYDERRG